MKTTLEIPDELYKRAKMQAESENLEIKDLVSQGLRLVVRIESKPSTGHPRRMTKATRNCQPWERDSCVVER